MKIGRFLPLTAAIAVLAVTVRAQSQPMESTQSTSGAGATAIFAGGCFWCVEQDFEKLPGVFDAESGYTAGRTENPSYESVSSGTTGHVEAVKVHYDPEKISYGQLVEYFWRHIDPTVKDRQFCDTGTPYRSGIYWQNEAEREVAEASRDALLASGRFKIIYTEVAPATTFWRAEEYHQDYYKKNPLRYSYYRAVCGRDARVAQIWGDKGKAGQPGEAAPKRISAGYSGSKE